MDGFGLARVSCATPQDRMDSGSFSEAGGGGAEGEGRIAALTMKLHRDPWAGLGEHWAPRLCEGTPKTTSTPTSWPTRGRRSPRVPPAPARPEPGNTRRRLWNASP